MKSWIALIILSSALVSAGRAEVADSGSNGFTVKINTTIRASSVDVYNKLVHNIGDWWNSQHTYSGDAHNLYIEEKPMGCFCEKLANGGVRHMEVAFFVAGKTIRLLGGLGPLQVIGASGSLTFNLTPEKGATRLEVTYAVTGYSAQGMNTWAVPVDNVLGEQIMRLKNYVETGNPLNAAKPN